MGEKEEDILVDVVFDGQQVVAHGLEGELVQDGGDGIEGSVQDDELRASFVWPLWKRRPGMGITVP